MFSHPAMIDLSRFFSDPLFSGFPSFVSQFFDSGIAPVSFLFPCSFWDCKGRNLFLISKLYFFFYLFGFLRPFFPLSPSFPGCKDVTFFATCQVLFALIFQLPISSTYPQITTTFLLAGCKCTQFFHTRKIKLREICRCIYNTLQISAKKVILCRYQ